MSLSDEIKEKINLKSYLERRSGATVKSEGASWHVRQCPFCNSTKGCKIKKSNPTLFQCFSCGAKGSVIDVCMNLDGISQKEAIAKLAKDEGIKTAQPRIERKQPKQQPQAKPVYSAIVDNCRPATKAECHRWLENIRHFPPSLAEKGAAMMADSGVLVNDHQGQKSLIFSIRDISGVLVGIQQQTINGENFAGMATNKRCQGTSKGYFFAGHDQERLVIVESVSNALALASAGFQAVCIYSAVNTGMIAALQNPSKELFLCLDAGMEEKQAQACSKYGIDGLWFDAETPSGQAMQNGYDINDLLIELGENNFAGRVNAMILQAARKTKSAIAEIVAAPASNNDEDEIILCKPENLPDCNLEFSTIHPAFFQYINEFVNGGKTEAPAEYVAASLLSAMAAAIGNKATVSIGVHGTKPNLYMLLIGDSTLMRKSTSLAIGTKALQEISWRKQADFSAAKKVWENATKEERKFLQKPVDESNLYPDDFSPESLLEKIEMKPDGLIYASELGSLLARMDSGYGHGLKIMLTNIYDCPPFYDKTTKTAGNNRIESPAINIIGASTLQWLQKHLSGADLLSGFLGRFCVVYRSNYPDNPVALPQPVKLSPYWRNLFSFLDKTTCTIWN